MNTYDIIPTFAPGTLLKTNANEDPTYMWEYSGDGIAGRGKQSFVAKFKPGSAVIVIGETRQYACIVVISITLGMDLERFVDRMVAQIVV